MLMIQPYHHYSRPGFKGVKGVKGIKGIKEVNSTAGTLTERSQSLVKNILKLMEENDGTKIYRSKRFLDGSFIEIRQNKTIKDKGVNIKYMRMNQRPVEMYVGTDGEIRNSRQSSLNVNSIIEKYFPDIIERSVYCLN